MKNGRKMSRTRNFFRELKRYPSATIGLLVIIALLGLSIYTMIKIPYGEAIRLWRGGEDIWYKNPRQAAPAWYNFFTRKDLPISFSMNSANGSGTKSVEPTTEGSNITLTFPFEYNYDSLPQDIMLYFDAEFVQNQPFISILWRTPDGREIRMAEMGLGKAETYRVSQDSRLRRILGGKPPIEGLFSDPQTEETAPIKGTYELVVEGFTSEPEADIDAEFVLHGQLYGIAGTDHMRRDLSIALMWGTPIALAFGLIAALGTTLLTMMIAAIGVWYGGWLDDLIQRTTEVNLVLPFLPILIMVGTFFSRSIWLILGVTILLGIFGGTIKTYRAMFLQAKDSPYIEAARAYGASNSRIIFRYLTPRLIPTLIPQLVTLIPTYVFLEASLAVLGLGDPVLPTWGKVINDARSNGALYEGLYYWVLEPAIFLMIAGLAFALLGFALDRIFNPKLREV
jgi:peptide/nickel transport system permease protein